MHISLRKNRFVPRKLSDIFFKIPSYFIFHLTLAAVTGLNASTLAANTALIQALLMFLSPFFAMLILGKGFKGMKGVWGITLISSLAFVVPAFLAGTFIGPELPDIIGSMQRDRKSVGRERV